MVIHWMRKTKDAFSKTGVHERGFAADYGRRKNDSGIAGTRVLPITEDVAQMFQAIIEDRNAPKVEKSIDGYSGFLFYDDNGMPLVAMHWQHRFNHMVGRYNDIYRVQMPNITPHVCRHTYCSNMAKSGMNPKTLQYLMGHSDISVTMNVYTMYGRIRSQWRKADGGIEFEIEVPSNTTCRFEFNGTKHAFGSGIYKFTVCA